ncbi:restriction endonuclease subunit S [Vibrio sp. dsl-7]|uniref:Restriction endonuclease subunit S n=1 Tax=Vibrio chanodichtyis TaxID=3027932 RepID=A0ABT5V2I3_9VIBR|nr:restriction endonuclease subunit S [Vibrio chanodichtyis]MDE1515876.1 restriction endonuclease subunit S [Vibrio chanodichtyis]
MTLTQWKSKSLGYILEKVVGGGTPSKAKPQYWDGDIPWASVKDLSSTKLDDTADKISEEGLNNSASNLIPAQTIVIPTRMALGKVAITTQAMAINQDLKALFPSKEVCKSYLFQWLIFHAEQIASLGSGSTVKGIRLEQLKKIPFSYPTLKEEQQKIAEILSTVDKKIDLIDQKIAETEKLKTGLMQKLFSVGVGVQDENGNWHAHTEFHSIKDVTLPVGWKLDNLGTLLEKIVGGGTPSKAKPEYWGGSIPWASVKDFKKPWLSSDCIMDTITNEGLKNSSANLIEPDVVVIPTRMALGKVAMTKGSIAINQDLKALYPKNIIDNLFLFYWLQHQASKIESLGSGSTVAGIRLEILKSIDCLYPESISEQKQISRILKCTDSKIDLLIEQKVVTQKLKKGLMQKLLTGKWRVPVEETEAA